MLVKRILKTTLVCGLGIIVGKSITEEKHKNDVKKILSADYMDDHTKVELMQDLNNIKINKKAEFKELNVKRLKRNIKQLTTKSTDLAKQLYHKI